MNLHLMRHIIEKRKHYNVNTQQSFGTAVKLRRLALQLTLEQSAEEICSISYLSKVENNQIIPSDEKRLLIQEKLQLENFDMTPAHFKTLTELWLKYVTKPQLEIKNELLATKIESNHFGLFHKYMLAQTIKPDLGMPIDGLFQYFNMYSEENIFLILYCTVKTSLKEHLGQQAHELMQWLEIKDFQDLRYAYLYFELKIDTSFQCQKVHVIEKDLAQFTEIALELYRYEEINEAKEKVKALLMIYDKNPDTQKVSKKHEPFVKYFIGDFSYAPLDVEFNDIYDIIFAYRASSVSLKELKTFLPKKNHIVFDYIKVKETSNAEDLVEYIRDMIISYPLSQYDFISVHFVLNQAINDLVERHYYKEAHLLSQKLHITLNMLRKT